MLDKINELGCVNVTKHCVDPSVRVTLDVEYAPFSAATGNGNGRRYIDSVRPRVTRFIDESCISNAAFHQELTTGGGAPLPPATETCSNGVRVG